MNWIGPHDRANSSWCSVKPAAPVFGASHSTVSKLASSKLIIGDVKDGPWRGCPKKNPPQQDHFLTPLALGILVQICSPGFQDDMADALTGLPWLQFDIICSRTRTCGEMLRSATSQDSAEDIARSKCGEDVENIMLFADLIGEQFLVEL